MNERELPEDYELSPKMENVRGTDEMPILRIGRTAVEWLNFDEILEENYNYLDFAELVGNSLLKQGVFDDSDLDSDTVCVYTVQEGKKDALREQMEQRDDVIDVAE